MRALPASARALRAGSVLGALCAAGCGAPDTAEMPADPSLDDAEVVLAGFDSIRVRMIDGTGEVTGDDGSVTVRAGLTDWRLLDDIDGDGVLDGLAVAWSSGGGSGTFMELVHFALIRQGRASGRWVWHGAVPLGDRVRVRAMTRTDAVVELHVTEHGPDDPLCCPTAEAVRLFEMREGVLRPTDGG